MQLIEYRGRGGNSLIAQLVKNRPAMQETPVRSLGWEDPLEKGTATHSSIAHGITKSWTLLSGFHFLEREEEVLLAWVVKGNMGLPGCLGMLQLGVQAPCCTET